MANCPNCSAQLDIRAASCSGCNAKFSESGSWRPVAEAEDERLVWAQPQPQPQPQPLEHIDASRVVLSGIFALVTCIAAAWICYLLLKGNAQLLGRSPTTRSYFDAIVLSSGWLIFPLLAGASSALFVVPRKLPWFGFVVVFIGTVMLHNVEPSFILLPIYAILLFGSYWLAGHAVAHAKNWMALPISIFFASIIVSGVIWYAHLAEDHLEAKARALCAASSNGMKAGEVLALAQRDRAGPDPVRWLLIDDQVKAGEGKLGVGYRSDMVMRVYNCDLKISNGAVASATFSLK